jgi:hypothetical protein
VIIAHVGGVPVEETLLPLLSVIGVGLLLAHAWVMAHVRRPRNEGVTERYQPPSTGPERPPERR